MDTNNKQLEKLSRLYELIRDDTVTPKVIEQFLTIVLNITKTAKEEFTKDFQSISQENQRKIHEAISIISEKHFDILSEIKKKSKEAEDSIDSKISDIQRILAEAKATVPEDGRDADEEFIIESVLERVKLPEYELFTLQGEDIVEKINALPTDEDNYLIDAKHIRNLPVYSGTSFGGGNRFLSSLVDVDLTGLTKNGQGQYVLGSGGSSLLLQTNDIANGSQSILNLKGGANITLVDDGTGGVTISATGDIGTNWGSIGGTLSDQLDLQAALDAKYDASNPSGYVSDLSSFDTDDLTEGSTNLYSQWDDITGGINYAGGRVGVGTATPDATLHAKGSTTYITISESTNNDNYNKIISMTGTGEYGIYSDSLYFQAVSLSGGIDFYASNSTPGADLHIDPNRNVGISTSTPLGKLDVVGTSVYSSAVSGDVALRISDIADPTHRSVLIGYDPTAGGGFIQAADTNIGYMPLLLNPNSGNVGIGNTSPSQRLHVTGSARITGAFYDSTNSPGTSGYVLSSTATGTEWIANTGGGGAVTDVTSADGSVFITTSTTTPDLSVVAVTVANSADSSSYIAFFESATGVLGPKTNSGITYNATTGVLVTSLAGTVNGVTLSGSGSIATSGSSSLTSFTGSGTSSGTNTGDQTITLTGDVTGSGTGSFATAIAAGVIVNADINASAAIAVSKLAALTANRVVITDASGFISAASATTTQLSYLDATSSIQTQLNGKQASLGFTPENVANKATDFTVINNTLYPTVQAVSNAITTAVTGLLDYRGSYDASTNLFPATGGSGTLGAILIGDFWICSVAGTLGGLAVTPGDLIIATVDTPGQTSANWDVIEHNLGTYVTSVTGTTNRITSTGGLTPAIDIAGTYVGQTSLTTLGTIGTGTWQATLIAGQYGGTGVANTGKTITLGGSFVTSGAFATTLTSTATTNVTLPISGTLYGTATGSITSSQLATSMSDETGSGALVFATSPTLVTPALGTPASGIMTNVTGTATGLTSGITNALKSATTTVDVSAATAPSSGQVLTATSSTSATWQTPSAATVTSIHPTSDYPETTSTVNNFNANNEVFLRRVQVPYKITVTSISVRTTTISGTNPLKLAVFSEDGATQLISVTSAAVTGTATVTTAVSSVVLNPGIYYFAMVPTISNTLNLQVKVAQYDNTPSGVAVAVGSITLGVAAVMPSTIAPASIVYNNSKGIDFRFN